MSDIGNLTKEKPFEGILGKVEVKRGSKKDFVLMDIDKETYFYFDIKYFNEHKDLFREGVKVNGAYIESEYKGKTNRIIQGIGVLEQSTLQNIPSTSNLSDIDLMKKCFEDSMKILDEFAIEDNWNSEDYRAVAISLFIQRSR